jgi:hypothetical protein
MLPVPGMAAMLSSPAAASGSEAHSTVILLRASGVPSPSPLKIQHPMIAQGAALGGLMLDVNSGE